MYKVYCYPLNESTTVKNKIEAVKVYKKYYNEMLELICNSDKRWTAKDISTFIEYSTDCINAFTNGSEKFYLTVGMGICPIHKISIKNLKYINRQNFGYLLASGFLGNFFPAFCLYSF